MFFPNSRLGLLTFMSLRTFFRLLVEEFFQFVVTRKGSKVLDCGSHQCRTLQSCGRENNIEDIAERASASEKLYALYLQECQCEESAVSFSDFATGNKWG